MLPKDTESFAVTGPPVDGRVPLESHCSPVYSNLQCRRVLGVRNSGLVPKQYMITENTALWVFRCNKYRSSWKSLLSLQCCTVRWVPDGDPEERPGDLGNECQDEDTGGAAPGLPETHRGAEGVPLCKGGALQHAAGWCEYRMVPAARCVVVREQKGCGMYVQKVIVREQKGCGMYVQKVIVREQKGCDMYVQKVIVREQKVCCVYCMNCITATDP